MARGVIGSNTFLPTWELWLVMAMFGVFPTYVTGMGEVRNVWHFPYTLCYSMGQVTNVWRF